MNINADILKKRFVQYVDGFESGEVFSKGAVVGVLKKCCGSDTNYRLVLKQLTGHTSSKELNDAQWMALCKFVNPMKPDGGKWQSAHGDLELSNWCNMLINAAVDVPEQERMQI